jgi:anhydro-N-acetylmuramic acid kinase
LPAGNSTAFFSTDVGPGNTLMDQFIQSKYPGKYYDKNAELALSGSVNEKLLEALLDHPFFKAAFPKTTGPELFSLAYVNDAISTAAVHNITDADVMATLAAFSAKSIILAVLGCISPSEPFEIYISGGGMYNPVLKKHLEDYFNRPLKLTSALGIDPDAKEAVLFALLANEAIAGGETSFGNHPGMPSVSMGKFSFPE